MKRLLAACLMLATYAAVPGLATEYMASGKNDSSIESWRNWHRSLELEVHRTLTGEHVEEIVPAQPLTSRWWFKVYRDGHVEQVWNAAHADNAYFNLLCIRALDAFTKSKPLTNFPTEPNRLFMREEANITLTPDRPGHSILKVFIAPAKMQTPNIEFD